MNLRGIIGDNLSGVKCQLYAGRCFLCVFPLFGWVSACDYALRLQYNHDHADNLWYFWEKVLRRGKPSIDCEEPRPPGAGHVDAAIADDESSVSSHNDEDANPIHPLSIILVSIKLVALGSNICRRHKVEIGT